jgi:polyphenol oxidase
LLERIASPNGVALFRFASLADAAGVVHGVSGRTGGASGGGLASLNVSFAVGDDSARVLTNRRRLVDALGISEADVVCAAQVHGTAVARVGRRERGAGFSERETAIAGVDGLVTDEPGVFLWLSFADCAPVLLFDPVHRAVGIAHAGWRGTVGDVVGSAVRALTAEFGTDPQDLLAAVGPAIGPCCYEVGAEVARAAEMLPRSEAAFVATGEGKWHFDLIEANAQLLVAAGVRAESVERAGICTSCRNDLLFSHRAQRGGAGRFAAIIGLAPADHSD